MTTASALRRQIESALSSRIPSALTPPAKMIRPVAATGIQPLDELLGGGIPIGALSELVGPECSGRTSIALSFLARLTQQSKICAWIDPSNTFDPISAAACGVDLARVLWVRCASSAERPHSPSPQFVLPEKYLAPRIPPKGLHGGGFGPHPRTEAIGMSNAIQYLLEPNVTANDNNPSSKQRSRPEPSPSSARTRSAREEGTKSGVWKQIAQALRCTDLILQVGGFSAVVLDMASLAPDFVSRIELSTWHRYRAAAERTQSSVLLLSQYASAKSSSELQLRLFAPNNIDSGSTVFTGFPSRVSVVRTRFEQSPANVVSMRKPPRPETSTTWRTITSWASAR